jgi:methionyl-tRNA synthetase
VRYLRLQGKDVLHVCGSDEHGVAITLKARKDGISPQQVVDKYHSIIKRSFAEFGIDFDIYSRTTSSIHHDTAGAFFKKLYDDGAFVQRTSEQYYDEQAQQFLADRYIIGACPMCGAADAYGDQCEKCGSSLSPAELIDPRSAISGTAPSLRTTTHWYLPLEQYETWLREWILGEHPHWKSNVLGQCKSWLDAGLQPRAVSRDLDWGVKVPLDNAKGKALYVWFDAPIGYISNTKELLPDTWREYWQDEGTELVHFIGKDNIVFHCIIFPAMLRAHGGYILPANVPANEFLNLENRKISTSKNWAVWLHEYLLDFPDKQDSLRYALTANMPETKDNNFTWKDFADRNNNELVAVLGNFVNRVMTLTHKHFGGILPQPCGMHDIDRETMTAAAAIPERMAAALDAFCFREALKEVMNLARLGNKYISDTEPWKHAKQDLRRTGTILHTALQISAMLSILLQPMLPFAARKLQGMLRMPQELIKWDKSACTNLLPAGHALQEPTLLFEKITDEQIEAQMRKLQQTM